MWPRGVRGQSAAGVQTRCCSASHPTDTKPRPDFRLGGVRILSVWRRRGDLNPRSGLARPFISSEVRSAAPARLQSALHTERSPYHKRSPDFRAHGGRTAARCRHPTGARRDTRPAPARLSSRGPTPRRADARFGCGRRAEPEGRSRKDRPRRAPRAPRARRARSTLPRSS